MADLLIRDLAPEVIHALDAKAKTLGISRVELVRRSITREVNINPASVTEQHLKDLCDRLPDLANTEIMRNAWS